MVSSNADRVLTCKECGAQFVFSAGEQEFYTGRGLMNAPGRCPDCRSARKARQSETGGPPSRYDNNGRRDRAPREMYQATCSNCGKTALVPFVPRGDKPVYCSECYEQVRSYR